MDDIFLKNLMSMFGVGDEQDPLYPLFLQDIEKYAPVMEQNKDKNFVQRIMEPNKWPSYTFTGAEREQAKSDWGSHLMSYAGDKTTGFQVFPQLFYNPKSKQLDWIGKKNWREAYSHAKRNNEYITFDNEEDAEHFGSYGYKAFFGDKKKAFPLWKFGYERAHKK